MVGLKSRVYRRRVRIVEVGRISFCIVNYSIYFSV